MRAYYIKDGQKYVKMTYESQYLLDPNYMTKRDLQYYYRYYNTASKGRGQCKRILLVIFCVCFFSYIFLDYNLKHSLLRLKSRFDTIARIDAPAEADIGSGGNGGNDGKYAGNSYGDNQTAQQPAYFVDTPGCRIPYFKVSEYLAPPQPMQRSKLCDQHKQLTHNNMDVIAPPPPPPPSPPTPPPSMFHRKNANRARRLSIMLLGIDGLSHLSFQRQLPRSAQYVRTRLKHMEFWGYNKVTEDAYGNLIPMLTGLDVSELELACLSPAQNNSTSIRHLDECPLVWRRYKEAGFQTLYVEEPAMPSSSSSSTPSPSLQRSFIRQPTDYYKLSPQQPASKLPTADCSNTKRSIDMLLDYVYRLLPQMQSTDFFSYIWLHAASAFELDADLHRLLAHFAATGLSNNTIIFLMSAHGQHWDDYSQTHQSIMEERQPLLLALYPAWLQRQYSTAMRNLRTNAHRLITPFDVHATLIDLLEPAVKLTDKRLLRRSIEMNDSISNENIPRGISLFLPVTPVRTCEHAGIVPAYCTCQQTHELQTNDARAQEVARFIVQHINARLTGHPQCRVLHLHAILHAVIAIPQRKLAKSLRGDYFSDYHLRIQTKPGLAEFETEVRRTASGLMHHTAAISRLNLHRGQSYCIDDDMLKMFCYCPR